MTLSASLFLSSNWAQANEFYNDPNYANFKQKTMSTYGLSREQVVENMVDSGLWVAFRTRPFSQTPAVDSMPRAIFVNAMDTNPLAADPAVVIAADGDAFTHGLTVLAKLTEGKLYLSKKAGADVEVSANSNTTVTAGRQ